jgi:hypothetical protein
MKNIGGSNLKIRADVTVLGQQSKMIIDALEGIWMWTSTTGWVSIGQYSSTYAQSYNTYTGQLAGWTSGNYTYTDPTSGVSVTLSNIQVDPTLADSIFEHT